MNKKENPGKLGRGLSALLGENTANTSALSNATGKNTLPIEHLVPGKFQPRQIFDEGELKSLADSIGERGILQPILVRPVGDNQYEIIAGERRWRAAQLAKLHEVPVIIREMSDEAVLEAGLVENVQRADLSPIEEAAGYKRLMDEFGYTQEKLASVIGKSRSHIANTLRLESLPSEIQTMVNDGRLSAGHARALVGHDDAAALARKIVAEGLSVRATEKLVSKAGSPGQKSGPKSLSKDPDTLALEKTVGDMLGLKVTIDFQGEGGKISINYRTLEQLDDVISRLSGQG